MFANLIERVSRLYCKGSSLITLSPDRVVVGPVVKTIEERISRIPAPQPIVPTEYFDIGRIVFCEGKHPKRDWKAAIVKGIRTTEFDFEYWLVRDEPNAKPFYRSKERVSFVRATRPAITHRRKRLRKYLRAARALSAISSPLNFPNTPAIIRDCSH